MKSLGVVLACLAVALAQIADSSFFCWDACVNNMSYPALSGCVNVTAPCLCSSTAFLSKVETCVQANCIYAAALNVTQGFSVFCSQYASVTVSISPTPRSTIASSSSLTVSSTETGTATTFSTQISSSANSGSVVAGAAQTSGASDTSSGESSSGKYIGIGVGVGLACAIVIGGLLVWFLRKRRKSSQAKLHNDRSPRRSSDGGDKIGVTTEVVPVSLNSKPYESEKSEQTLSPQEMQAQERYLELQATQRRIQELEAKERAHELQVAKQRVQELEAQQRAYELEARQRYELEHARDRYTLLSSNENTLPSRYQNARSPQELAP